MEVQKLCQSAQRCKMDGKERKKERRGGGGEKERYIQGAQ
jgi:hypothetical protein